MTDSKQDALKLSLSEKIQLAPDARVQEILEIDVSPEVEVTETDSQIDIKGSLVISGRYQGRRHRQQEDNPLGLTDFDTGEPAEQEEIFPIYRRIPISVGVSRYRVKEPKNVWAEVEDVDFRLDDGYLLVDTSLALYGIADELPLEKEEPLADAEAPAPFYHSVAVAQEEQEEEARDTAKVIPLFSAEAVSSEEKEAETEARGADREPQQPAQEPQGSSSTLWAEKMEEEDGESAEDSREEQRPETEVAESGVVQAAAVPASSETEQIETVDSAAEATAATGDEADATAERTEDAETTEAVAEGGEAEAIRDEGEAAFIEEEASSEEEVFEDGQEEAVFRVSISSKRHQEQLGEGTGSLSSIFVKAIEKKESDEADMQDEAPEEAVPALYPEEQATESVSEEDTQASAEAVPATGIISALFGAREERFTPLRLYRVKPEDSLSAIADQYGTTVQELLRMNRMETEQPLHEGQMIRVPVPEPSEDH